MCWKHNTWKNKDPVCKTDVYVTEASADDIIKSNIKIGSIKNASKSFLCKKMCMGNKNNIPQTEKIHTQMQFL